MFIQAVELVLCRAEEWDLANPMITGVLQVYQKDLELYLRVFEPKRKQDDVMVLGLADMVRQMLNALEATFHSACRW